MCHFLPAAALLCMLLNGQGRVVTTEGLVSTTCNTKYSESHQISLFHDLFFSGTFFFVKQNHVDLPRRVPSIDQPVYISRNH